MFTRHTCVSCTSFNFGFSKSKKIISLESGNLNPNFIPALKIENLKYDPGSKSSIESCPCHGEKIIITDHFWLKLQCQETYRERDHEEIPHHNGMGRFD